MCSWTAKRYNKTCREMYERLKAKGKPERVIKIAIANKLLKQVFAVATSKQKYIENYQPTAAVAASSSTIANGANLIYNAATGTWESDTVEAYFDSDTWQANPWGLEFRLELSDTQFYWRNATSSLMYYFKEYRVIRIADGALDWMQLTDNLPAGHQRYVWRDNSLNLYNSGDQEEMKVRIYGGVGYWQEYHIILSVGIGYNDNHLLIKRLR